MIDVDAAARVAGGRLLRVLHLEDSLNDAELVAAALAAEGIACTVQRVDTREAFVEALDGAFDLILADYALPSFDGATAQALAIERHPAVPFIFVSGTLGEEVATERMKSGATDYVLKHHLARLPGVVRRALAEAEERAGRERAQAELQTLNAELEQRVADRTLQLAAANQALRSGEARLTRILETVADGIVIADMAQRCMFINPSGERILGVSSAELCEGRSGDWSWWPAVVPVFDSGQPLRDVEATVHRPDGTPVTIALSAAALRDETGTMTGVVVSFRDVTERRRAAEVVRQAKDEAEAANRAKSDFLSRMSHDLRTPLNAILGFAQLLDLEQQDAASRENVQHILQAGRHLLDLINEVLDIARIEAGQLSLSPESVAVAEVVGHVLNLIRPIADGYGIALVNDVAADGAHVMADRQRLRQVLLNLLSNAVKYNRNAGTVTVSSGPVGAARVQIRVTDTGRGVPADRAALLFQPFERLGAEQTDIEGTGLGLALSKGLTEAMGGVIGVTSVPGEGSTFWLELARAELPRPAGPEAPRTTATERAAAARGTVLYVEDNTSNVRLFERILRHRPGVELLSAAQGTRGIELAAGHRPDLIFLDLHLPDMTGEDIMHRLWADDRTRGIPVVILTADATAALGRRLLAAGASAYLTKPFEIARVLELIDEVLSG